MINAAIHAAPSSEPLDLRWKKALDYYRARKAVIFLSEGRFWEKHSFPQQSLAKYLVNNGVKVTWLDCYGWRPYRPVKYFDSPLLTVKQLFQLPASRFPAIRQKSLALQQATLEKLVHGAGGNPVIWVQDGHQESIVERLPYIDVYSMFDNPYLQRPEEGLCRRAKIILGQNSYATRMMKRHYPNKTFLALPPLDMAADVFEAGEPPRLPPGFPKKIAGCVGSLLSADFDYDLLEVFVRFLPDWGFLFMGRTDDTVRKHFQALSHRPNFHYIPWVPRSQVAATWKKLDLTLLLYRSLRQQDGAFPTRALESFHFGVPCIATKIPKTDDLEGYVPRSEYACELIELAQKTIQDTRQARPAYEHFLKEMDPRRHLAFVAELLLGGG